jgi:hypothetical protein
MEIITIKSYHFLLAWDSVPICLTKNLHVLITCLLTKENQTKTFSTNNVVVKAFIQKKVEFSSSGF